MNVFRSIVSVWASSLVLLAAATLWSAQAIGQGQPRISVGDYHSLASRSDGRAFMWGGYGYLGIAGGTGQIEYLSVPTPVPGLSNVLQVAAGESFSYAITSDGSLWAWGYNSQGQLGDGTCLNRAVPVRVPLSSPAVDVSTTVSQTLVLLADGSVVKLPRGCAVPSAPPPSITAVPGLMDIIAVAAGIEHGIALKRDGTVWAFGSNRDGQLGIESLGPARITTALQVPELSQIVAVTAGSASSFAIAADGTLWSWGLNESGQLGDGTFITRRSPVRSLLTGVVQAASSTIGPLPVAPGSQLGWTAVVTGDGSVYLFGWSDGGILSAIPERVAGLPPASQVELGRSGYLVRLRQGGLVSWGRNYTGQLGDGTFARRDTPGAVLGAGGSGLFDTTPSDPSGIPPALTPSITALVALAAQPLLDATATVIPRAQDVGASASTFIFALAPSSIVRGVGGERDPRIAHKAVGGAKDSHVQCALSQLNAQGQLVAVSAASLQAYVSGVLAAQGHSVKVLSSVNPSDVSGATFYVGYGANGDAMLVNGTTRSVVTVDQGRRCTPQAPQTGWWYNPAEGGRGFSVEARGNRLFMAAFHYDANGRATWNFAGGATSLDGSLFTSDFLAASGGQSLTGSYRLPGLSTVGPITLAFSDATHGTMFWPGGSTPIERQPFVPNGLTAAPQANLPESGWWWNPAESGRGFFIEWQDGYADLAGYMYDDAGNPTWYISVFPTPDPMRFTGTWWAFGGGQSMGGPYRPATRTNDNVGAVAIEFSSATRGTLTLPDGRRIAIERQSF